MTVQRWIDATTFRSLAGFPVRDRRRLGEVLLVAVLVVGLQVAFLPLAFVVDAGYSLQVARTILCEGGQPALPVDVSWRQVLLDGSRRCGIWLVFAFPGLALGGGVLLAAGGVVWQAGLGL